MNKTVLKTKELLDLFLDCERLTLPEMVERLQMPKTSVYRMAQSLVALGFLQKRGDHYELGLALLTFGSLVAERLDIRRVALPVMERLKEATNEAVNLVIRDGDEALYIEKVETSEPVRVYTKVGRRAPARFAGLYGRKRASTLFGTNKTCQNRQKYRNGQAGVASAVGRRSETGLYGQLF